MREGKLDAWRRLGLCRLANWCLQHTRHMVLRCMRAAGDACFIPTQMGCAVSHSAQLLAACVPVPLSQSPNHTHPAQQRRGDADIYKDSKGVGVSRPRPNRELLGLWWHFKQPRAPPIT